MNEYTHCSWCGYEMAPATPDDSEMPQDGDVLLYLCDECQDEYDLADEPQYLDFDDSEE